MSLLSYRLGSLVIKLTNSCKHTDKQRCSAKKKGVRTHP